MTNGKRNARTAVQQRVYRLVHQLNGPTAGFPWKGYPEGKERVVKVAAKLKADSGLKGTLGPDQRQGLMELNNSNPASLEKAHATPKQHQQQHGPEVPGASYELQVAFRAYATEAGR